MTVNGMNNTDFVPLNNAAFSERGNSVDFSEFKPLKNADKFVLQLPNAEIIHRKKEFVNDEKTGKDCAVCYSYMERILLFGNRKGGLTVMSGSSSDAYFAINLDTVQRDFSKSRSDMNSIRHACEETVEIKTRSLKQQEAGGSLSAEIFKDGSAFGAYSEFMTQSSLYTYNSISGTRGAVTYKEGGKAVYRENAVSSRELYNKCAVFLAGAFGEKGSEFTLNSDRFKEMFTESTGSEDAGSQLSKLRKYMEDKINAVHRNAPACKSLKTFADTYQQLAAYKYPELISLVQKILA